MSGLLGSTDGDSDKPLTLADLTLADLTLADLTGDDRLLTTARRVRSTAD